MTNHKHVDPDWVMVVEIAYRNGKGSAFRESCKDLVPRADLENYKIKKIEKFKNQDVQVMLTYREVTALDVYQMMDENEI